MINPEDQPGFIKALWCIAFHKGGNELWKPRAGSRFHVIRCDKCGTCKVERQPLRTEAE